MAGERLKRGESCGLKVKIQGSQTPIQKQWQKYIANPENKKTVCDFLVKTWTHIGQDLLHEGHQLVIGSGHKDDNDRAILITRGQQAVVEALNSDH